MSKFAKVFKVFSFKKNESSDTFILSKGIRDVSKWSTQRRKELESVYGCEYLPKLWANYVDGIQHLFDVKAGKMSLAEIQRIEAKTLILNGAKDFLIAREHVPFLRRTLRSSE